MVCMFYSSKFDRDISRWDVSNVTMMNMMFCLSEFNSDISDWDVSNVKNFSFMFKNCAIKDEYKPRQLQIF